MDLKEAIESKIEAPIDNLSLKIGNSSIDYNQTLEFYGIKENSLLRMDPKMRGGADRNLNDPEGSKRYILHSPSFCGTLVTTFCSSTLQ